MELVFGQGAILNMKHVANWEQIWQHKQLWMDLIHKRKNMRWNNHQYKVGDKILVKRRKNSKNELEFMGLFPIAQINENDMVRFQKGIIHDANKICRMKPFSN